MQQVSMSTKESPRRWGILVASAVILALTMGWIVNGLSAYIVPLEVARGWSRADIAFINTAGLIGLALGSFVMGIAADKYGIRRVVLLGITSTGVATIIASRSSELWQLYALFFVAGALGGGALLGPLMTLVGNWFIRGAGLALGIAAAGQALGQGGVPFTATFLIDALGWRDAMAVQGILTLIVLLPLSLFLRDAPVSNPKASLSHETPSGLSNNVITAWLSLAVVFCCTTMAVPLMHLVPLIQGKGFAAPEAGSVLFTMLMVAILGRIAFGKLADVAGAIPTYLIASGWQTVMVFGFIFINQLESFYLYAVIYGFGYAGVMTAIFVTVRVHAAPARRASTTGIVLAFAFLGHGLGGWQGGYFFDVTGAYNSAYANAAFAGIINLIIVGALWLRINRNAGPGRASTLKAA